MNLILDLVLFNSAGDSFDPKAKVNVVVYATGEVSYLPPGMFRSACNVEIYEFPFDEQICSLKFGRCVFMFIDFICIIFFKQILKLSKVGLMTTPLWT